MNNLFADSFSGRSVFVTGHTGFKGSWLITWLKMLGARITGYSTKPPTVPNNFEAARISEILDGHYEGDIRDSVRLSDALRTAKTDVIFHLAAQPLVRASYAAPRETFDINVMGTLTLLDCVRDLHRPCAVVLVTSDKCYENRDQVWGYRECDAMGGFDPYSASKGAVEIAAACYRRSFFPPDQLKVHGVKIATARAGNVLGGGDWAKDRIVPDAVRSLSNNEPIAVRNPGAVRPWQHVLEPLSGYLALASKLLNEDDELFCSGWNFGPNPGEEVSVASLIDTFCKAWGGGTWRDVSNSTQPHEAGMLRLNIDKSTWHLKWKPRWSVGHAVQRTAGWYRRYYSDTSACMREACLEDIQAYSATEYCTDRKAV